MHRGNRPRSDGPGTPVRAGQYARAVTPEQLRDVVRTAVAAAVDRGELAVDVPDDVVVERISRRGQGRADDNPETVRERLRVYHRETEPLVAYYGERDLLRRVDGLRDPDAVESDVRAALDADAS